MRHFPSKVPGQVYLWLAVPILAASSSVIRKLTELGAMQLIDGHNPISFCNVLFAGNLCALTVLLGLYRNQLTIAQLKRVTKVEWQALTLSALLSGAIIPTIIFQALSLAPVNNIVLLARIELPIVLVASIVILQERFQRRQIIGAVVVTIGILVAVLGHGSTSGLITTSTTGLTTVTSAFSFGPGEILTIISAILISLSALLNKKYLSQVPLGLAHVVRLAVGTLVFFVVANLRYGPQHFGEIFSPFLWKWMLVYGGIIIVIGQTFWARGFRATPVSVSAIVACFNPIAAMGFAYWILAEVPTMAQLFGGGILLLGLLLSATAPQSTPIAHQSVKPLV
jgi:drug/metabolite transporter (DMT)-like permease